jgi:hypothetical protein
MLDQLCRISAVKIDIVTAPPDFDAYVAAVAPTKLLQGLLERRDASLTQWIVRGRVHQHANVAHSISLLRARCKRPSSRRAADKRNEIASPHRLPLKLLAYHDDGAWCITAPL